jgi:hypothetical protein
LLLFLPLAIIVGPAVRFFFFAAPLGRWCHGLLYQLVLS